MKRGILIFMLCFGIALLLAWSLTPVLYAGIISIAGFDLPTKLGFPKDITFANYIEALSDREVWQALINSLIIAILATLISVGTTIPASYVFSRSRTKLSSSLMLLFLFFRLFPWIALAFPIFLVMARFKMLDTYLGVSIGHSVWIIPTGIWYMKGFFDMVPKAMEESAMVDGATPLQTLVHVILPLAIPGLITVALLAFFSSYTEYLYSLILTRVKVTPLPVLMAGYLSEFKMEWRKISAISMFSTVPMVLFYTYMLRYVRRGMLSGMIKG